MKKLLYLKIFLLIVYSCSSSKFSEESRNKIYAVERFGQLNRILLDSLLRKKGDLIIDSKKPLVIIYYPGKDACNSSGSATRYSKKVWFNEMEKGINKIKSSIIIYIYKDSTGLLGRNGKDGFRNWNKDPDRIIEGTFFKEDPPCSGYTLVSSSGRYISHLGEFDKKFLWQRLEQLVN